MSGTALLVDQRPREVWTFENKRRLDRLAEMLNSAEVRLKLECTAPLCPDPKLRLIEDATAPSGRVLVCGCKRRFFEVKPGSGKILH